MFGPTPTHPDRSSAPLELRLRVRGRPAGRFRVVEDLVIDERGLPFTQADDLDPDDLEERAEGGSGEFGALPAALPLISRYQGAWFLNALPGMRGELVVDGRRLSLARVVDEAADTIRGWIPLRPVTFARIELGQACWELGFDEPIDRAAFRPWSGRGLDLVFPLLLLASTLLHGAAFRLLAAHQQSPPELLRELERLGVFQLTIEGRSAPEQDGLGARRGVDVDALLRGRRRRGPITRQTPSAVPVPADEGSPDAVAAEDHQPELPGWLTGTSSPDSALRTLLDPDSSPHREAIAQALGRGPGRLAMRSGDDVPAMRYGGGPATRLPIDEAGSGGGDRVGRPPPQTLPTRRELDPIAIEGEPRRRLVLPGLDVVSTTPDPGIEREVRRQTPQLRSCYEQFRAVAGDLEGKVELRLTIGEAGQVGQVEIVSDTTREPGFAECLAGRVRRRWTVPAAPGYQLLLPLGFFD